MPGPLVIPAVMAGSQLIGQGLNALSQSGINKKTREWNERMYSMQRQHALDDWNRQNEYNNPAAQMARLKAAGLNPHLIYGGGPGNVSQPVRSTDAKSWNPTPPQFDLGAAARSAIFTGVDLETKQTQLDRINAMIAVDKQKAINMASDTAQKVQQTAKTKWEYEQAQRLGSYSLEAARLGVRELETRISKNVTQNEYTAQQIATEVIMRPYKRDKAIAEIANLKQQTATSGAQKELIQQNVKNQQWKAQIDSLAVELNSFMNEERKRGKNPNESAFGRLLYDAVDKTTNQIRTMRKEIGEKGFWKWLFDNGEYKDYYKY